MESSRDTMDVMGKQFLKCQQEDCEWNIGWLGGNSWSEESGKGIRICNLGVKALLVASELAPALEEVTLDVKDTADGPKLVVQKE